MAKDSVLEIKGLQKKFGRFYALQNVNLTLHKGEVLGFIGPNGAGKSTTIRSILGLIKATSGTIKIFGKDAWKESVKIHQHIAYVPGDVTLWPNLTGGQTIDLLLHMSGQKHNALTDQLIVDFKLDPRKKNNAYSKGNRQKVALIAAFATEAELYIFDEPTSGLDPLNEIVFQKQVEELKQKGKSVLLSSHILSEVERMCDIVSIIRKGEVIETGTLESMRHLTRSSVKVKTKQPLTGLDQVAGVHQLNLPETTTAEFNVDSEKIGPVITWLSDREIVDMKTTPPTLEELFLRYYNNDGLSKAGE